MQVVRAALADLDEIVAIRLRALTDSPGAFASTLQRERSLSREDWLARMANGAWWLARPAGAPPAGMPPSGAPAAGVVAAVADPDEPAHRQLVGMWVEPAARGGPAAERLVAAVVEWAAAEGSPAIVLWVVEDNARARRFYQRMGFVPTGRREPLPGRREVVEAQMIRYLDGAQAI